MGIEGSAPGFLKTLRYIHSSPASADRSEGSEGIFNINKVFVCLIYIFMYLGTVCWPFGNRKRACESPGGVKKASQRRRASFWPNMSPWGATGTLFMTMLIDFLREPLICAPFTVFCGFLWVSENAPHICGPCNYIAAQHLPIEMRGQTGFV